MEDKDDLCFNVNDLRILDEEDDNNFPSFGPGQPGSLFFWNINSSIDNNNRGKMEIRKAYLDQLLAVTTPFLTLRYVEGLKVTLGTVFVGRGTQGEVIWLDLSSSSNPKSVGGDGGVPEGNYLSLECKEGTLWVSCHGVEGFPKSTSVSINGVPLATSPDDPSMTLIQSSALFRRLLFGDFVSISFDDKERGVLQTACVFLFEATPVPPSTIARPQFSSSAHVDFEVEARVIQNPLILEKILCFLPTGKLKGLRYLSSFWNMEALKALRARVVVSPFHLSSGLADRPEDLMQVSSYAHSLLGEMNFPSWKILFVRYRTTIVVPPMKKVMLERKILDDLLWFFDPNRHTHNVQSLSIVGVLESSAKVAMLETVLSAVKDTLATLDLELTICFPSPVVIKELNRLRTLTLSLSTSTDFSAYQYPEPASGFLQPLIQVLIGAVGSPLQTYTLRSPSSSDTMAAMLGEMVRVQEGSSSDPPKFTNLTNLKIDCPCLCTTSLGLLSSLQFSGLKKLQLQVLPRGTSDLSRLQLESLDELIVTCDTFGNTDMTVTLPLSMPQLRILTLFFILDNDESPPLRFNLQFGPGEIVIPNDDHDHVNRLDYLRHFPSLSKLTVWPVEEADDDFSKNAQDVTWRSWLPFILPFLQTKKDDEDGLIVPIPTLQTLDIPFLLCGSYHPVLDHLEVTFPNAAFPPELAEARGRPAWSSDVEEEELEGSEADSGEETDGALQE